MATTLTVAAKARKKALVLKKRRKNAPMPLAGKTITFRRSKLTLAEVFGKEKMDVIEASNRFMAFIANGKDVEIMK